MKIVCIDFDGVIHQNMKWLGVAKAKGSPVPGALEAIEEMSRTYRVMVHSARCDCEEGFEAVKEWLELHGFSEFVELVRDKPRASVYLDDRAVCFTGDWVKAVDDIKSFRQWQRDQKLRNRMTLKRARRRG